MLKKEARDIIRKTNKAKADLLSNQEKYELGEFTEKMAEYQSVIIERTKKINKVDKIRFRLNVVLLVIIFASVCTFVYALVKLT